MPTLVLERAPRLGAAGPPRAAGARQVWLADALRWCRRNQVPVSVPGLRRSAAVAAAVALLAGGAVLVALAVLLAVVVGAVTGQPGDARAVLPWLLLASAVRPVLLGLVPARRAAIACPADVDALDALELGRAPVWRARVLLPALAAAVPTTVLGLVLALAPLGQAAVPVTGLVGWCLLPLPAALLGAQLGAVLSRSTRELPGWWWAGPVLVLGLLLGDRLGRWYPAPPRLDDATVLALAGRVVSTGALLVPAGWVVLVVAVAGAALTLGPARRELRRPWVRGAARPATPVRSVLATEVHRGTRLATRVHRRLADAVLLAAALVVGFAVAVPWAVLPTATAPVLVGASVTVSLVLAVSLVTSQGPLVHADTLRWLVDAGLPPRRVVDRHLRESVRLVLVPVTACGVAVAVLARSWWLAPVTVLLAVGTLLVACWADLADPSREAQSDGTAESGVVAALLTALGSGLLVAPFALLPVPLAVASATAATVAVAVLLRRRLLVEVAGPPLRPSPSVGRRPHPKEQS